MTIKLTRQLPCKPLPSALHDRLVAILKEIHPERPGCGEGG
jgi:hypothetical protein